MAGECPGQPCSYDHSSQHSQREHGCGYRVGEREVCVCVLVKHKDKQNQKQVTQRTLSLVGVPPLLIFVCGAGPVPAPLHRTLPLAIALISL